MLTDYPDIKDKLFIAEIDSLTAKLAEARKLNKALFEMKTGDVAFNNYRYVEAEIELNRIDTKIKQYINGQSQHPEVWEDKDITKYLKPLEKDLDSSIKASNDGIKEGTEAKEKIRERNIELAEKRQEEKVKAAEKEKQKQIQIKAVLDGPEYGKLKDIFEALEKVKTKSDTADKIQNICNDVKLSLNAGNLNAASEALIEITSIVKETRGWQVDQNSINTSDTNVKHDAKVNVCRILGVIPPVKKKKVDKAKDGGMFGLKKYIQGESVKLLKSKKVKEKEGSVSNRKDSSSSKNSNSSFN